MTAPGTPLAGTTAVVTGGGRGLGREIALALASAGARVGLIARSGDQLRDTARVVEQQGGTTAVAIADISDRAATAAAINCVRRALGPIDLLVNNAGVTGPIAAFHEADQHGWWRTIEINLGGATHCTHTVLPDMIQRGRGRIINITSEAGTYRWPTVSAYSVAKSALIKFTENLAAEVHRYGIGVFSFHPGILPVGFATTAETWATPSTAQAKIASWTRQQRANGHGAETSQALAWILARVGGRGRRGR